MIEPKYNGKELSHFKAHYGGCYITTNVVHIESHYMKYYPKRTSKRYKKNRRGYR